VRSADIAARCREIALRVQCSGEWGELGDTLCIAATEIERLRLEPSLQEEIVAWSVDLHDAREKIKRLEAEVERLRLSDIDRQQLRWAAQYCADAGWTDISRQVEAIAARLGGGE